MPDIPGDSSTTSLVTIGSTTNGSLETIGDHDWYRIQLGAGQAISVALNGTSLEDPYLRIRDAAGTMIYENDDISGGINRNSLISFSPSSSGVYFIDAGSWNDGYAGDYQIVVSNYVPPAAGTIDQLAYQLTTGYWSGDTHHFPVSQGGSITVDVTGLTAAGQNLAHEALGLWSDIIGVNFTDVTGGAQITFDDNESGASDSSSRSGGITTSAHVNVSTQWLTDYGTTINSYAFQTYIHEIGHALGLGHAGNYNETARYPYEAVYSNDGWPVSVMSYFDQRESSYYANRGFTKEYVITPMIADIVAVGQLYGLSTTTRTGNTVYGFNSTANRSEYNASLYSNISYTVFDSGGNDTLDYSGFSVPQNINLTPEVFSDVGGRVGNVVIARGTTIENAIGGSTADQIVGNSADNVLSGRGGADVLTGGGGADTFSGTIAEMNGDRITDFSSGDQIVFTDGTSLTFLLGPGASTLTYSGSMISFGAAISGTVVASSLAGGGVALKLTGGTVGTPVHSVASDFTGDGRSDILWRNDAGVVGDWLGSPSGAFAYNAAVVAAVSTGWHIVGTGDFNGDGRSDILWRNDAGTFGDWLGNPFQGITYNSAAGTVNVSTDWHIVGTGDFNGDGRSDILWRNDAGTVGNWLANAAGGFAFNAAAGTVDVASNWHVVGTGDFNGDGRSDILWRNDAGTVGDWLANASGGFAFNAAPGTVNVSTDWHVVGTGDFNGDGRSDILWRNDSGAFGDWLGQANGGFVYNAAAGATPVTNDWHIAAIGDYNGDGRSDLLWRNDAGQVGDWLAQPNGGFAYNAAAGVIPVANEWHVQAPDIFWS